MITDFTVEYRYGWGRTTISKVYAVDAERDMFLIADDIGRFEWAAMDECTLCEEEVEEEHDD